MKKQLMTIVLVALAGFAVIAQENAEQKSVEADSEIYTVAVLPFNESGAGVQDNGKQISNLLFAKLVSHPNLWFVEREALDKIIEEAELNISGAVNPAQAIKIGQLSGAKILITGTIFKMKDENYIVAKIIGTETSRVTGVSVNGTKTIAVLADDISKLIGKKISSEGKKLMPEIRSEDDILASIKKSIAGKKLPKVFVSVAEKHVGAPTIDPAAETELQNILKSLGAEVTASENDAEIIIKGEGFSEFAGKKSNLIFVKARLEVKALDKAGNIIAVDRQTCANVDLAEQIAGKKALQNAAAKIAERMLPALAK